MKPLRDQRGTLYEIPILIMFLAACLAVGSAQHSLLKGLLGGAAVMFGFFIVVVVLGLGADFIADSPKLEPLRRAWDSRAATIVRAILAYAAAALVWAVIGGFTAMFFMTAVSDTPQGQLSFGRAMTGAGGFVGLGLCAWLRRQGPRF